MAPGAGGEVEEGRMRRPYYPPAVLYSFDASITGNPMARVLGLGLMGFDDDFDLGRWIRMAIFCDEPVDPGPDLDND